MGQKRTISPRRHDLPTLPQQDQIGALDNQGVVRRHQERRCYMLSSAS